LSGYFCLREAFVQGAFVLFPIESVSYQQTSTKYQKTKYQRGLINSITHLEFL
jgi:hypothetical protein